MHAKPKFEIIAINVASVPFELLLCFMSVRLCIYITWIKMASECHSEPERSKVFVSFTILLIKFIHRLVGWHKKEGYVIFSFIKCPEFFYWSIKIINFEYILNNSLTFQKKLLLFNLMLTSNSSQVYSTTKFTLKTFPVILGGYLDGIQVFVLLEVSKNLNNLSVMHHYCGTW